MGETETMRVGGVDWLPLRRGEGRVLLLSRDILALLPYDSDFDEETWGSCELRGYLNGEFLARFTEGERSRILETEVFTGKNPWYDTPGGEATRDRVFLLSIEEAVGYFGDTLPDRSCALDLDGGRYVPAVGGGGGFFSGAGDGARRALFEGRPGYWWLRSPGVHHSSAAVVMDDGGIAVLGFDLAAAVDVSGVGVRPALWLRE